MHTYTHHKDKVQSVEWHPTEGNIMLSAGYDRQLAVFDAAAPGAAAKWTLTADVESVRWNPHNPKLFYVRSLYLLDNYPLSLFLMYFLYLYINRSHKKTANFSVSLWMRQASLYG